MSRSRRLQRIRELQKIRNGSHVISYITSTRPNLEGRMAMDAIPVVYRHLQAIKSPPEDTTIDLFLHSNGGEGVVPWRLVTLIRDRCAHFNVLIPNRAFSAATLAALGADKVIMHPMGMLGPTDPTVTNAFNPPNDRATSPGAPLLGISVEDVTSYFALVREDVGIGHEDELIRALTALTNRVHPLALGNVKRSTSQSRILGEKLLSVRGTDDLAAHQISEIIQHLTSQIYYHGHPINRREAREDIGLPFVVDASPEEEAAMWALYLEYDRDLLLNEPYDATIEAIKVNGGPPAVPIPAPDQGSTSAPPAVAEVPLPPVRTVFVESTAGCNTFETKVQVTIVRTQDGTCQFSQLITDFGWTTDSGGEPAG